MALSDQQEQRRKSLELIKEMGVNPYPPEQFKSNATTEEIQNGFDENINNYQDVSIAGRLMGKRGKGKVIFAELQDSHGRIQLYIKRDDISPGEDKSFYNNLIKKYLDLGDYIGVKGHVFKTKMGETTIWVKELKLLSKSLRPLPVVKKDAEGNIHDAFTDPEQRYRQRYVDLTVNPQHRNIFVKRSKMISAMRAYFDRFGWLEVETPILQQVHGGAAAKPFETFHNTLDTEYFLRIANELYLKKLIVGGFDGVYEIGRMFRNEGMDRTHNPEFTSMEIYVAYKDYEWMMKMVEDLLTYITKVVNEGSTEVQVGDNIIDFKGPYTRLTMYEVIEKYSGIKVQDMDEDDLRDYCKSRKINLDESDGYGKLIDKIFSEDAEPNLIQPTYITDYPIEMTPLAKRHRENPDLVEQFELFVNGKEIANAYTELNDPLDQRRRFEEQLKLAERGDEEAMAMDEDFIRALEYGMPPTSGLGIGMDRLAMLLTNQESIQEVIFFPQMRPETPE